MKPCGGLIKDIETVSQLGLLGRNRRQVLDQLKALALSATERVNRLSYLQIALSYLLQPLQAIHSFLCWASIFPVMEEIQGLIDGGLQQVGNAPLASLAPPCGFPESDLQYY